MVSCHFCSEEHSIMKSRLRQIGHLYSKSGGFKKDQRLIISTEEIEVLQMLTCLLYANHSVSSIQYIVDIQLITSLMFARRSCSMLPLY